MSIKPSLTYAPVAMTCLALLASCSGDAPRDATSAPGQDLTTTALRDFVNGTRLTGDHVATIAGESQQIGIFDRVMDTPCRFVSDDRDQLRCLPENPVRGGFVSAYTDAACTAPLLVAHDLSVGRPSLGKFATIAAPGGDGFEVRAVTTLANRTPLFERNAQGACVAGSVVDAGTPALSERVDPARFVAASSAGPRFADRPAVTTWQIRGEDGSVFQTGLYDTRAAKRCNALRIDEQAAVCLDGTFAMTEPAIFADGGCTQKLVSSYLIPNAPPPTPAAFFVDKVAHAVGPRWEGPVFQRTEAGICEARFRDASLATFVWGEPLHPPRLSFVFEGAGRIKREVLRDGTGVLLGATGALVEGSGAGLLDAGNGGFCAPLHVPDGSFRCVSLAIAKLRAGHFADARCSVPTIERTLAPTFSPSGGSVPGLVALLTDEGEGVRWGKISGAFEIGEGNHAYYQSSGSGACTGPYLTKASSTPLGAPIPLPAFEPLITNR